MTDGVDRRFDPNHAAQLLLDLAHEQSVEHLLRMLVTRVAERPNLACAQVWLVGVGDRCGGCVHRAWCPDRARCLHLAAGEGWREGGEVVRGVFDDPAARHPLGVGFLGAAASAGEQRQIGESELGQAEVAGFEWMRSRGVRSVIATPIVFRGEVLGLLTGFTRMPVPEESRPWGRIFADHVGAALANARAFEEIRRLKAQLELRNAYLQEEVVEARAFGDLVGQSAALRQVISQIDLVAPTEASVLILGETGTGKELVAREIHRRSPRKDGPLVRVNCASIPRDLFESEFFGHVKGAFTGAIKDRAGRFETAEGGTLFLDEVGEVSLEMQAKLLRVLQEKRYERVGDDRTREANVRIIAATNRDLKQAVVAGRFREDLYYRIHVFPIHVTRLRERKDDIPLLARHFVEVSVRELKCARPKLTRVALMQLQAYDWPGNVRELRNVIERAVILARGGPLAFDLPGSDGGSADAVRGQVVGGVVEGEAWGGEGEEDGRRGPGGSGFLTESEMRRRERENLRAVLERTGWKVKGSDGAAALLGLKPTTLLSRMKAMGLRKPGGEGV